jgi:hypothetical protein
MCGKERHSFDGRCDVYKLCGIRDSTNDSQANYAMEKSGKQRQVLFDEVQNCAQLYHSPVLVPNALFDGLDDDDVPAPIGTPTCNCNGCRNSTIAARMG